MTDQVRVRPSSKGERAEELARSGGRDAWALVLAANDIADAIRELTDELRKVPLLTTSVSVSGDDVTAEAREATRAVVAALTTPKTSRR